MHDKLSRLLDIGLTWLERILTPRVESTIIRSLFGLAAICFSGGLFFSFRINGTIALENGNITFSLSDNPALFSNILGLFFVFLAIAFYFITKIKKNNKAYKTLKKASPYLRNILNENRRVFLAFGPNAFPGNIIEIRTNMGLWFKQRESVILPNNDNILEIISNIKSYNNVYEKALCDKMKTHINAFKQQVESPSQYPTKFFFPKEFSHLIDTYCATNKPRKLKAQIRKYKGWLLEKFRSKNLNFDEVLIYGSLLTGITISDVDLLLKHSLTQHADIRDIALKLIDISTEFENTYKQSLHIMCFSGLEQESYTSYKGRCGNTLTLLEEF
jgi:hypothetical protein